METLIKSSLLSVTIYLLALYNIEIKAQGTNKNLYFLADTINIPKNQRIISINKTPPPTLYENKYEFFCKCLSPYDRNVVFYYINTKIKSSENILNTMPNHKYLSWQELAVLLEKEQLVFDRKYNLHIVEVLPKNRYKINLVKLERYSTVQ